MKPGSTLTYTVTYLEMAARPSYPRPPAAFAEPIALIHAEGVPVWYFLSLYDAVGADHHWTDQHERDPEELRDWLAREDVDFYSFLRAGWPQGFFILDGNEEVNLAYFGLVPQAIGKGFGQWLVKTAIHMAWDRPGAAKLTVNTNTLDHPRALPLYQRAGFEVVGREEKTRVVKERPRHV